MTLSKNDWKPIQEFSNLKSFVNNYPNKNSPRFEYYLPRDISEDAALQDLVSGNIYPAELVRVTNEKIAAETAQLIKERGVGNPNASYFAEEVIKTIQNKINKNYSDVKERILVINADECVPFSWVDKWQPVITYAMKAPFHAVYAIQHNMEKTDILELKKC